ncbi:MAG: hypothetical protein KDB27_08750 [Planctomycetales bacterium]|nr:hypothetical protein [Planctomycetales bacterium]
MEPTVSWRISGTQAVSQGGRLHCEVDVAKPSQGLENVQLGDSRFSNWSLLRTKLPGGIGTEPVAEHYVRGNDLIVTYKQTPNRTVRPQLCWRAGAASTELIVSVQTSLLESCPAICVGSRLVDGEAYSLDGESCQQITNACEIPTSAILFRPNGGSVSYLELVHPSDANLVRIEFSADQVETQFEIFNDRLEKGVIRRGRLRSHFIDRASDVDSAIELMREFQASPAPLTT